MSRQMTAAFRSSCADAQTKWHWLLRIKVGGDVVRYADESVDVQEGNSSSSLVHYPMGLEVVTAPNVRANPYEGTCSVGDATVRVHHQPQELLATDAGLRLQDREVAYGYQWGQADARLYLWAEDTTLLDAQCRIMGNIERFRVESLYEVSFDIVSWAQRYDIEFPRYFATKYAWANVLADDAAMGYPIFYGDFVRQEIPLVHTGSKIALAAEGALATISDGYHDENQDIPTLGTTTDADGIAVSKATFSETLGSEALTISGTGYKDNAKGEWHGDPAKANLVIRQPHAIVHHFVRRFLEIPASRVDSAFFTQLAHNEPFHGWQFSLSIGAGDTVRAFDAISDIMKLCRACVYADGEMLTVQWLNFKRLPARHLIPGNGIISFSDYEQNDTENVANRIAMKYRWTWNAKKKLLDYTRTAHRNWTTHELAKKSKDIYGEKMLKFETKNVAHERTAEDIAGMLLDLRWRTRGVLKITANALSHTLSIYDTVLIDLPEGPSEDGAGFLQKKFSVVGITYGTGENELELMETDR